MPYIKQSRREIAADFPVGSGELNFAITSLVLRYLGDTSEEIGYKKYNEVIGALECAKLELYRRRVSPYEDEKIKFNGDVY